MKPPLSIRADKELKPIGIIGVDFHMYPLADKTFSRVQYLRDGWHSNYGRKNRSHYRSILLCGGKMGWLSYSMSLEEVCNSSTFCLQKNDDCRLKSKHDYLYQVQCQLYCADKEWCDFVLRTDRLNE